MRRESVEFVLKHRAELQQIAEGSGILSLYAEILLELVDREGE